MVLLFYTPQKMVTVMPNSGDQKNDRSLEDKNNEIYFVKPDDDPSKSAGYDYDNLYGLLAIPFTGILLSILTYFLRKYHCHRILGFLYFVQNDNNNNNNSYGSQSTATPPIILYRRDFSDYNTSQTSTYASTHYLDKEIQTSLPSIDPVYGDEDNFKNSETESDGSELAEEDVIYIKIHDSKSDQSEDDHSTTRSGAKYK